jgi:hypothetical protein
MAISNSPIPYPSRDCFAALAMTMCVKVRVQFQREQVARNDSAAINRRS